MADTQYPVATFCDWAPPPLPRPSSMKRFSERKLCAQIVVGQLGCGEYDCFDPTSILSGYYGRFGLSLAEGNYVQLTSEVLDLAPFELGTPYITFDRLPSPLRALFAAGGTLHWARTVGLTVTRQWHRLHAELNLRPGARPVARTLTVNEGVSLTQIEAAGRMATWEYMRDAASGADYDGGRDLLGLEELGVELNTVFETAAPAPLTKSRRHIARPTVSFAPVEQRQIPRDFKAPIAAGGMVDQSFNQLREIIEFHQTLYLSATPFDLANGLDQAGVHTLALPLHSGVAGTNEIVNDMDVYDTANLIHA